MTRICFLPFAALFLAALPALAEESGPLTGSSELIQRFQVKEARQGVGVDADAFYAVDNTVIAKYDKKTGALIARWEGDGSAIHLDSAAVVNGKRTRTVVPCPSSLSISSRPPCSSTKVLLNGRPRPVPS